MTANKRRNTNLDSKRLPDLSLGNRSTHRFSWGDHQIRPSVVDHCEKLESMTRDLLPALNHIVDIERIRPEEMSQYIQPWVSKTIDLTGEVQDMHLWEARRLLQPLGFVISSVEKHFQEAGHPPGYGLNQMPGFEDLLLKLGTVGQHPPRDSHHTAYLWNEPNNPLTYTLLSDERFFIRSVISIDAMNNEAIDLIRAVTERRLSLHDFGAAHALVQAAEICEKVRLTYQTFLQRGRHGEYLNITPRYFTMIQRTYRPMVPIGGQNWHGANAGHVASQVRLDFLIGTTNDIHQTYVERRLPHMLLQERKQLEDDQRMPSVTTLLLDTLDLQEKDIGIMTDKDLHKHIRSKVARFPVLETSMHAYRSLVDKYGQASALHWTVIHHFITKFAKELDPDERKRYETDMGKGGEPIKQVFSLLIMRKKHPVVSKLGKAIKTYFIERA